jgi:hypothetical protein
MPIKLSPQREKFCQFVVDGMTQSDAYLSAYNTKSKGKTLWIMASRLAADVKVRSRLTELRSQIAEKQLWTREKSVKILGEIADASIELSNNKIAAIKELNAMHGFSSAKKIELTTVNPLVIIRHGN